MRFTTFIIITIFAFASRLVSLATAKPVPNKKAGSLSIPLSRHSSFLDSNKTVDLDAISSHGISVREKILSGLDNYEMNTGMMHPLAVKRSDSESGLGRRGAGVPLTPRSNKQWMGQISIGTPPKTLNVHIDTGAADMWVLQTGCAGISGNRDLWNPDLSTSAANTGESFQFQYSDKSVVKGARYTDAVTIAGFTADSQTFGSTTAYTSPFRTQYPADGLLGLAFPTISQFGADPLFASLVKQNKVINPTFSFKFTSSGGEMYVGGANSMLYKGDIAYTPITHPGLWQVSVGDVRVAGSGDKILENIPAIFDTGASFIFGDWDRVGELYRRIGGTLKEHRGFGFYYMPCDSFPTLGFTFAGQTFEIPASVLRLQPTEPGSSNCISAIVAQRSRPAYWNIGLSFLQNVYSVFDYSTLQVGFAQLA